MNEVTMQTIEAACKAARDARLVLKTRAEALQDEIAAAQKRKLPGIRSAVETVARADAELLAALQEVPLLFRKPKSVVFHGLQVGYKAGAASIEISNPELLVKRVREHFPDKFEQLVKVKETPIKSAIKALTVAELQKLGVKAHGSGEVVFITDATDSVDKLVKALLKGAETEQEAEEEEA
jgi:hypothetical protein